jgi:hypothetical protein
MLIKNDLAGAEKLLARLDKACTFGCEEFQDLKKSIQQYKAKKRNDGFKREVQHPVDHVKPYFCGMKTMGPAGMAKTRVLVMLYIKTVY